MNPPFLHRIGPPAQGHGFPGVPLDPEMICDPSRSWAKRAPVAAPARSRHFHRSSANSETAISVVTGSRPAIFG